MSINSVGNDELKSLYGKKYVIKNIFSTFTDEILLHRHIGQGVISLGSTNISRMSENQITVTNYVEASRIVKMLNNIFIIHGVLIDKKNNCFISGAGYHYFKDRFQVQDTNNSKLLGDLQEFDEVFYIGSTNNFGHWVFEYLPKIIWYKHFFSKHKIPLLIGNEVPKRWYDFIFAIVGPDVPIATYEPNIPVRVKKFFICAPSVCRNVKNEPVFDADVMSELRYLIRNHFNINRTQNFNNKVVYASRKLAKWRKVENEDEFIMWMQKYFKVVIFQPEKLSIQEQFDQFSDAKIFFGTGGANMMHFFFSPGQLFCDVREPGNVGWLSAVFSDYYRLRYYKPATLLPNSAENDSITDSINKNVIIDIKKIEKDFKILGIISS
tara:strand:- start:107 stop:1246 length:1140 start_codon:yes stop_codon:yes gene_type:complete